MKSKDRWEIRNYAYQKVENDLRKKGFEPIVQKGYKDGFVIQTKNRLVNIRVLNTLNPYINKNANSKWKRLPLYRFSGKATDFLENSYLIKVNAFVVVNENRIGYDLFEDKKIYSYRIDELKGEYGNEKVKKKLDEAINLTKKLIESGKTFSEIAKSLDVSENTIYEYSRSSIKDLKRGHYFSSISRNSEWFNSL